VNQTSRPGPDVPFRPTGRRPARAPEYAFDLVFRGVSSGSVAAGPTGRGTPRTLLAIGPTSAANAMWA